MPLIQGTGGDTKNKFRQAKVPSGAGVIFSGCERKRDVGG